MTTIIETERLQLRRFTLDGAPFFMALLIDGECNVC